MYHDNVRRFRFVLPLFAILGCGGGSSSPGPAPATRQVETPETIFTFLNGKTLVMAGVNIPSHPNGYSQDMNFGAATQCYHRVRMSVSEGNFQVESALGSLETVDGKTTCNREKSDKSPAPYTSTAVMIENVKPDRSCFDITFTYIGFKQEGRGSISEDGKSLSLELFFENQASGHRCADGAVGAKTVILKKEAFTGNAVQVYTVSDSLI